MSKVALDQEINNENWTPLKKSWLKLKIIRREARETKSKDIRNTLKKEEIKVSRRIVRLSKTVSKGNGDRIAIPFFAILGSKQDGE